MSDTEPRSGRARIAQRAGAIDRWLERVATGGLRTVERIRVPGFIVDLVLAAATIGDALLGITGATTWEVICSLVAAAAMFVRRRYPVVAWLATIPGLFIGYSVIGAVFALATLAHATTRRWLLALSAIVMFVGFIGFTVSSEALSEIVVDVIYGLLFAIGPIAVGQLASARTRLSEQIAEITALREHEREQAASVALARERATLAREMHDVVSHQVTLIAVQAAAIQVAAKDETVRRFARTVRQLCVATLQELRDMVQLLRRSGGAERGIDPQPALSALDALIDGSGLTVEREVRLPSDLTPAQQRAVYRFAQEALTNVRKHAPGATVALRVAIVDDDIVAVVRNGRGTGRPLRLPGSGLGLVGLRERATLLGGRLDAAAQPDGGWVATMTLPLLGPR